MSELKIKGPAARCVVVGGAGFLGSHLVNHLINDRRCEVLVVDNLCAGRREFVHPEAKFAHADIAGSEAYLESLFRDFGARWVFNYAASPYVPDSYRRPIHVFMTNAVGAMNVINAAHAFGCWGVLQVSSAELYGNWDHNAQADGRNAIDEDDEVCPHSTYGASKAAIDYYVQARWMEAKVPCVALRQFNCVGERETHPYVVPEIVSQLARQCTWWDGYVGPGKSAAKLCESGPSVGTVKLGNNSSRDFMYAGDAVRAAVRLLEACAGAERFGEVFNLGSETSVKVYDLAAMIGQVMGFDTVAVEEDARRKRAWEVWHLQSDNEKLKRLIGDFNQTDLHWALVRTVEDYLARGRKWCWEG